jgi:hypothetical protein
LNGGEDSFNACKTRMRLLLYKCISFLHRIVSVLPTDFASSKISPRDDIFSIT